MSCSALRCILPAIGLLVVLVGNAAAEPPKTEFLTAFNAERKARALHELRHDSRLGRAAQRLAEIVIRRGEGIGENDFCQVLENAGLPCAGIAQLVTVNPDTPRDVAASFFEDRKTRRAAATLSLNHFGVGYAERGANKLWYVLISNPPEPANRNWRQMVLEEVNRFRARYALRPLRLNGQLNRAAQAHADDMAARDFFAHETPEGRSPAQRARAAGYRYRKILENLAAGQPSPKEAVEGWKNSPGHRKAMLDRDITEAGIGYRFQPNDNGAIRSSHYWAMSMGRPQ
ncbi:MAG: CAP domain-containing protein [Alphaproteobacteria bacterium]